MLLVFIGYKSNSEEMNLEVLFSFSFIIDWFNKNLGLYNIPLNISLMKYIFYLYYF